MHFLATLATCSLMFTTTFGIGINRRAPTNTMDFSAELKAVFAGTTATPPDDTLLQTITQNSDKINEAADSAISNKRDTTARSSAVCTISDILYGQNSGVVTTQSDSNYTPDEQVNWSQTCWLPAQCFIKPRNAFEVAVTLKIIILLNCKFAVRGAGHNAGPGFAGVGPEGVLIDMRNFSDIKLSSDKSSVSVGPGTSWDKVYGEVQKSGLTVVGGRVGGVGVGGLILGGGMSHFTNAWGMVADHVKRFEIVLASSQIVTASATSNQDLFKALKGGGPNFGIITKFELYTTTESKLWYTTKVYSVDDVKAVMQAATEVEENMTKDTKAGFYLSTTPSALVAGMVYRDYPAGTPAAFAPFDKLTPIAVVTPETNGTQQSSALAQAQDSVASRATGTVALLTDADFYAKTLAIIQQVSATAPDVLIVHTFQPVGPPAVAAGNALGGNVINIKPVKQSWLGILTQWTDSKYDQIGPQMAVDLITKIKAAAKADGKLLDTDFMNDANANQSPLRSYGTQSVSLLKAASTKYDPQGVFQKLQNNGFLLSKADSATVP